MGSLGWVQRRLARAGRSNNDIQDTQLEGRVDWLQNRDFATLPPEEISLLYRQVVVFQSNGY